MGGGRKEVCKLTLDCNAALQLIVQVGIFSTLKKIVLPCFDLTIVLHMSSPNSE